MKKLFIQSNAVDLHKRRVPISILILIVAMVALLITGARDKNRTVEIAGVASPSATLNVADSATPNATRSYEQALADANRAIALNPNERMVYYNRALLYSQQKSYDLAIADFNHALQLDGSDASSYFGRGMAYVSIAFQQKDAAKQAQIARQAVTDLRHAQRLGYALPYDIELAVSELEAQLGRPEATTPPEP